MSMSVMRERNYERFKESSPLLAGVFITAAVCGVMMCLAIVVAILTTA